MANGINKQVIQVGGGGGGTGDVVGPASSTDNALARFDSTNGKIIQNGIVIESDTGTLSAVNSIILNTSYSGTPVEAEMFWDATEKTYSIKTGLDTTTLQIGREEHILVRNNTGSTIVNGKAVYITGSSTNPTIALAQANDYTKSSKTIGVTTMDIANGTDGLVTILGLVHDMNTSGFAAGDVLYLDNSTTGGIINTNPTGINYSLELGLCIVSHAILGVIYVVPKSLKAFPSDEFKVTDATDKTKQMTFNVSGITPGTKRTYTMPNQDVALVGDISSQTLTNKSISLGTNTITTTKSQLSTAVTDGDVLFVGDITQYTDELAQDATGAMIDTSLVYVDATPLLTRAALTGAITASQGSNATSLGSFTTAQLNTALSDNDVATGGGTATGTNTGDQTITLTGGVTGSGTGSFAATVVTNANLTGPVTSTGNATAIANGAISNAMLANGAVANLSGTNTGDNAVNTLYSGLVSNATHTGDATGATALTLATVNSNVGTFGSATQVASPTVNAKGLVTAISNVAISIPSTAVSDFNSASRAQTEAELVAGTNITITPSGTGATRQLTIASTGGGGSLTTQDEGSTLSTAVTTLNFTGAGVTASGAGSTTTINIPGGSGSFSLTETEIDFGSGVPVRSKRFTITNAGISPTSKIMVSPSGNVATGRVGNDWEWDDISFIANPGTGNFVVTAISSGRVRGKRKILYSFS